MHTHIFIWWCRPGSGSIRKMNFWTMMHNLYTNIWTWNILSLLAWRELTALSLLLFDFCKLVAPSKTKYYANIFCLQLFINVSREKILICKISHLGCSVCLMQWFSIFSVEQNPKRISQCFEDPLLTYMQKKIKNHCQSWHFCNVWQNPWTVLAEP